MPAELLTSKLFIPPVRPSLVPRPRLVQLLNEGLHTNRKLTLISAPAGFGKTTLVIDWLRQTSLTAAWLSVDEADNELPRFLAYLAAAFQQVDEEIGAPLRNALESPQPPAIEKALTDLLNDITVRANSLVLVLDDVHLLSDAEIWKGVEFLLQHQPPQLHLVLTTREDPDLPLARLRARDQITEIRALDLRFTREEAGAFLQGVMGLALSEQDVAVLESRTEGWAAGLQLAGLSMQRQADLKSFIEDFSGSHRHILDYLTDEVLQQQPEEIRTFLLQTSVLDRLCGQLCDALTGRLDCASVLVQLEAANLFLIPLDEVRRWYRYHHLFSDLLRSQLTRSHPELIPELHRRASCWYEENGDIQAAVEHALRDTDLTRAAQLIEQHVLPKLFLGEVAMVVGWFDRLPEAILESAPMLCIGKAWALALLQRGPRTSEIDLALQSAERALEKVKADQALRDLTAGHAASIQAFILEISVWKGGKPEKVIALSQEAQRLLPEDEKAIRSVNGLNIGYGYLAQADLKAASLTFRQVLEDGLSGGNYYAAIYGSINLVLIAILLGHLQEALQLCNSNIERFNRILAGQNFPPIGALYILKGSILLEYGHLAEAERSLTGGLDLVRLTGETVTHKKGYAALARLRAIQGDRSATFEALSAMEEIWSQRAPYAQALRHRLSLCHWPGDSGLQVDAQVWLSLSGIDFGELAVIDSIDHLSVAYFESYLHAAHVLARLVKAVPGAYPLEDAHTYLKRQMEFAETRGLVSWFVAIATARTLLYQAAGKKSEALESLEQALIAAAPAGFFRTFLDEYEPLQGLLEELQLRWKDETLTGYAVRLLEAMGSKSANFTTGDRQEALLSERELEVLQNLARGLSYEEIGQQLFLSLNTVQTHVKHIYRKLMVNKRAHAIEKARELKLI